MCQVAGARRYSLDLVQGGLEIPCILKFVAANQKEVTKTIRLLRVGIKYRKSQLISLQVQLIVGIHFRPRALL